VGTWRGAWWWRRGSLVEQWQDELYEKFGLSFELRHIRDVRGTGAAGDVERPPRTIEVKAYGRFRPGVQTSGSKYARSRSPTQPGLPHLRDGERPSG